MTENKRGAALEIPHKTDLFMYEKGQSIVYTIIRFNFLSQTGWVFNSLLMYTHVCTQDIPLKVVIEMG